MPDVKCKHFLPWASSSWRGSKSALRYIYIIMRACSRFQRWDPWPQWEVLIERRPCRFFFLHKINTRAECIGTWTIASLHYLSFTLLLETETPRHLSDTRDTHTHAVREISGGDCDTRGPPLRRPWQAVHLSKSSYPSRKHKHKNKVRCFVLSSTKLERSRMQKKVKESKKEEQSEHSGCWMEDRTMRICALTRVKCIFIGPSFNSAAVARSCTWRTSCHARTLFYFM
jgi:hypothetical protein